MSTKNVTLVNNDENWSSEECVVINARFRDIDSKTTRISTTITLQTVRSECNLCCMSVGSSRYIV